MKEMLTNAVLTRLPETEFARLMPLLEPVSLSTGERLAGAGEVARFVYLPESAIISCHADMQDGRSVEVGMIGKEGLAGLAELLGSRPAARSLSVAVGGSALRARKEEFERESSRGEGLRRALLGYAGEYVTQVSQRFACAALHHVEQRFAVWLLMLTDRLGSDTVEITQERAGQHLGVRRVGVTVVADELRQRGVISYTRGLLRVADRRALEAVACECYAAMMTRGMSGVAV